MNIRIPPPIQTAIAAGIMLLTSELLPHTLGGVTSRNVLAVICLISAAIFMFDAVAGFIRNKTTVNPLQPEKATTLVISGVYKFTRNPMYLGMLLILLALAFFLGNLWNTAVLFLYIWVITRIQILPEEQALIRLFGDQYTAYCEQVRRWL